MSCLRKNSAGTPSAFIQLASSRAFELFSTRSRTTTVRFRTSTSDSSRNGGAMPLSTPELPFHPNVARSHFEEPWFENLQRPDNHLHPYRDPKSLYCCGEADVVRTKFKVCATGVEGRTVTRCPICNSKATEIDRGLFEGMGFDCRFHGRFRVSGTVLAQRKGRARGDSGSTR